MKYEQLDLFSNYESKKGYDKLSDELCKYLISAFNNVESKWKNLFVIKRNDLEVWENSSSKNKQFSCMIGYENPKQLPLMNFMYDDYNQGDFTKFNNELMLLPGMKQLSNDNDFQIRVTPDSIHIFYHDFDTKDITIPKPLQHKESTYVYVDDITNFSVRFLSKVERTYHNCIEDLYTYSFMSNGKRYGVINLYRDDYICGDFDYETCTFNLNSDRDYFISKDKNKSEFLQSIGLIENKSIGTLEIIKKYRGGIK